MDSRRRQPAHDTPIASQSPARAIPAATWRQTLLSPSCRSLHELVGEELVDRRGLLDEALGQIEVLQLGEPRRRSSRRDLLPRIDILGVHVERVLDALSSLPFHSGTNDTNSSAALSGSSMMSFMPRSAAWTNFRIISGFCLMMSSEAAIACAMCGKKVSVGMILHLHAGRHAPAESSPARRPCPATCLRRRTARRRSDRPAAR